MPGEFNSGDISDRISQVASGQYATLTVQTSPEEAQKVIDQIIAAHPKEVASYRQGKERVFGFFVGQVMKATQGKANPRLVNELLKKKL